MRSLSAGRSDVPWGVPGSGELRHRHVDVDVLVGLGEVEKRVVKDDKGLLEIAEDGEERVEAISGGVLAKAVEEELALGDIVVRDDAHNNKDVEVAHHRVLKDVEELVRGEALDELAGFEGGELEGVRRVVVENKKASIKGKLKHNILIRKLLELKLACDRLRRQKTLKGVGQRAQIPSS